MNEPKLIPIPGAAETVSELIELLHQVPGDYAVTLSSSCTYGIVIDTQNRGILIDDIQELDKLLEEQENQNTYEKD